MTAENTWAIEAITPGSDMVYPGAGIAISTGSSWAAPIANNSASWNAAYTHSLSAHLTLGTTSSTAYRGDYGATAYNHAVSAHNYEPAIAKSAGYVKWTGSAWSFANEIYSLSNHGHGGSYETAISKATGYLKWTGTAWQWKDETYSLSAHSHIGTYAPAIHYHHETYAFVDHIHSEYEPIITKAQGFAYYDTLDGWSFLNNNYALYGHTHSGYESAISKSTGYLTWNGSAWVWKNEAYSLNGHIHIGYEPAITKSAGYAKWTGSSWWFTNETYSLTSHLHTSFPSSVNFDNGTLYVDATNNRVGVNTTSPQFPLQLATNDISYGFQIGFPFYSGHGGARTWGIGVNLESYGDFGIFCSDAQDYVPDVKMLHITSGGLATMRSGYFIGNCSAESFTDRTPFYEGDALAEIKKIKGHRGEIDHTSLPAFVRVSGLTEERDLGAMISVLTVAIQQLNTQVEELQKNKK
jgi:hypothetical protein